MTIKLNESETFPQTDIVEVVVVVRGLHRNVAVASSYQQQRLDLRAQLGLAPDEDDSADVRHAKRVDELQRQIAAVEAAMGSAAPDLERAEAEVTAAEQAAAALQADRAATEAAIEQAGVDAADLRARLPRLRQRAGQREACLRQQHQKLAEIDAAIDAQAEREKQAAARQSAPAEAAGAYLARAPHPPALAAPPTAVLRRGLLPVCSLVAGHAGGPTGGSGGDAARAREGGGSAAADGGQGERREGRAD